jgi:dTDP-4-dehydrorhamnose 3,5-epimerase
MIFHQTILPGAFEIHLEPMGDERGHFARTWCRKEFANHGLNSALVQCSLSFNTHKGTLRGLHYQASPWEETKLVRCTRGAFYDVVVDLRPNSPTFTRWIGITLTATNGVMVYIPEGCAHGFLTLEDNSEMLYQMSEFYHPEAACGVRWNDPLFGIIWPAAVNVISDRDRFYRDSNPTQWIS